MKLADVIKVTHRISNPCRVANGKDFELKNVHPADTGELKAANILCAKESLVTRTDALAELRDMLSMPRHSPSHFYVKCSAETKTKETKT
jgi:hypothetical protein